MNCAFTIVAKNYIGLGQILEKSFRRFHEDVDFFIFVVDEFEKAPQYIPANVIVLRNELGYTDDEWIDMSFKYDLTEFCTSVKPACFQWVFNNGYEKAMYLDPDIFIFASLDVVYEKLEKYDVALTPQIAGIHVEYTGEHPEWAMNVNGIFNLGFCAIHKTNLSLKVLDWWRLRLKKECFTDRSVGDFTDQKWMDWMPGLLGNNHLYVFQELGMNMAPWNFFERKLFMADGNIMVKFRTDDNEQRKDLLRFMHFAGYDYVKMKEGVIARKRIQNLEDYADLSYATGVYINAIVENKEVFDRYINQRYSYSCYENGDMILSFHRRLYHGMSLKCNVKNPYSVSHGSFYAKIKKRRMIISEKIDGLTQRNVPNIEKKRRIIAMLFSALYRIVGYKRYVLFVKSLYNYCRPEEHTFLIKK